MNGTTPPDEDCEKRNTALKEALAYTENIVDTVREPLLVLDTTLHVVTASLSFYRTFGVSPQETLGNMIYELGNGQWNIPALRTLLEEVLPQKQSFQDFEVVHEFPSIGIRVMLLNGRKLWRKGNHTEHILLAIEDVTERKRIADELVRSNEDLQRFAYMAAHDLRSPLNSGLNILQLLGRRAKNTLSSEDADMLALAISNFKQLGRLMEDLLSYSAAENAPHQQVLVSLEEPLSIALTNLQHHIKAAGAAISACSLPSVPADRTQLVMVFQNLIGNAIKYRRQEPPQVRIEAVQQDEQWRISISDNGQGFSPEHAAKIFEPFKRLHGTEVPGSGIGLATCKRVIERLGGRIWAESQPGVGSTFYFTLPQGQISANTS